MNRNQAMSSVVHTLIERANKEKNELKRQSMLRNLRALQLSSKNMRNIAKHAGMTQLQATEKLAQLVTQPEVQIHEVSKAIDKQADVHRVYLTPENMQRARNDYERKSYRKPLLHHIIQRNHLKALHVFLDTGSFDKGMIQEACVFCIEHGTINSFKLLITHPETKGLGVDMTLLMRHAARHGRLGIIEYLVDNVKKIDDTILHEAAAHGHSRVCTYLLSKGAHVDAFDTDDMTPLQRLADRSGNLDTAKVLLRRGANMYRFDNENNSLLQMACASGFHELLEYLLERGHIDLEHRNDDDDTALMILAQSGYSSVSHNGIEYEHMVDLVLQHGARADAVNVHGETPLMLAAQSGFKNTIDILLENVNVSVNSKDRKGKTALMHAIEKCKEEQAYINKWDVYHNHRRNFNGYIADLKKKVVEYYHIVDSISKKAQISEEEKKIVRHLLERRR